MIFDEVLNPPPIELQVNDQGIIGNVEIPHVTPNKYGLNIFQDLRARLASYCVKQVLLNIYDKNRKTSLVVGNAIAVIIIALVLSKVFKATCPSEDDGVQAPTGVRIYCDKYTPIDRVVVDVDLNVTNHCHSSKSCVALAESLWESQGKLRYNFIIGSWGFVYVGNGFKCRSEERENALYIRLPVESALEWGWSVANRGALTKFKQILAEGLECSRILNNYTITITGCEPYDDRCIRYLKGVVPDRGQISANAYFRDDTRSATLFKPFSLDRVYSVNSYLVECTTHLGFKY